MFSAFHCKNEESEIEYKCRDYEFWRIAMNRTKSNFNGWRAIAHSSSDNEHLLYMGMSMEQVKKNFPGAFYDLLVVEEQLAIESIFLEKWHGSPDSGYWVLMENLKVPRVFKQVN